jgi:DNA-binding response OmpR family regulator
MWHAACAAVFSGLAKPSESETWMTSTILIVEDDRDIAIVFTELFIEEGYQVKTLHDGRRALEFMRSHHVDLMISDVRMPGMDGITLAQAVRTSGDETPIILVSAIEVGRATALVSNVVFLKKPVNLNTLLDAVEVALPDSSAG